MVVNCLMATTGQAQEKVIQESGTSEAPRTDANARSREELRRESRRRAKRLNRLSSLVSLWLKTVAVDLTQKPQTPLEKQVRKELTYELLDALRHSGELGAHRRGKKRELSGLEAKLLELFMEFEKLPFAAKENNPLLNLDRRIPRIQVFRIRRKYRKRWPEREKQAYEELKSIFLREIQRAQ